MKRIITILAAVILPVVLSAQAQITTKKMKIADFTDKTTKVVLTGNSMFDSNFQNEIKACWNASSYEFCTLEEYQTLRSNPEYYFLMNVTGKFKAEAEPGIEMLTLVKGGLGYDEGIDGMLEVVSVPFRSAEDPNGRELVMLPALLRIIQQFTLEAMEKDIQGYTGLSNYTLNLPKSKEMNVILALEDLAPQVNENYINIYDRNGISILPADDVDDIYLDETPGTIVSYTVAPSDGSMGSYCYKMLIGVEDGTLYFFKRHKISKKYGAGFLVEDLKKIASVR